MLNRKTSYLFLCLFLFAYNAHTQNRIKSPYSRFGLGELQANSFARPMAMGGVKYALRSNDIINFYNPASYSAFDTTTFVFETGVLSAFEQLKTADAAKKYNYTNLNHLVFGMPITKWWGLSFGLIPFSSTGYNISYSEVNKDFGEVIYNYEGSGGINQFYLGNAFRYKNFSVGFNASYMFGKINKNRQVYFPDSISKYYGTNINNSVQISDFYLNYGMQYLFQINKEKRLVLGAVFGNTSRLYTEQNDLIRTFKGLPDQFYFLDTIANETKEGNITFPIIAGLGFSYETINKLILAGDVGFQKWSDYGAFDVKDSLKDVVSASFGVQYTPQKFSSTSYIKRMTYRMGIRYSQNYLEIRDKRLDEFGLSFGFGFPLRKSRSTINLAIELGKKGTTKNNLIQENYGKITLGFSIFERWFIKNRLY
jgi:hypothetical protein